MKEIIVLSGKGGAGKTTIVATFNIIAKNNVPVDVDVEAANLQFLLRKGTSLDTTKFFGMQRAKIDSNICAGCGDCAEVCVFDAIHPDPEGIAMKVKTNVCEGGGTCTHVCPTNAINMVDHEAGLIYKSTTEYGHIMFHADLHLGEENTGLLVAEVRRRAKEYAINQNKDWIITDGPPGIGCPVTSSITGANFIVLAIESSVAGISDFTRILDLVDTFWIPRAVIINKYDLNLDATKEIEAICARKRVPIIGKLPYDLSVQHALASQMPVVLFDPESRSSEILKQSWDKLLHVIDEDQSEDYEIKLDTV